LLIPYQSQVRTGKAIVYICLSSYLYLSIYLSIYHLSIFYYQSIYHLSIYLSIYHLCMYLCMHVSIYLSLLYAVSSMHWGLGMYPPQLHVHMWVPVCTTNVRYMVACALCEQTLVSAHTLLGRLASMPSPQVPGDTTMWLCQSL
jgi:hypothetical protein